MTSLWVDRFALSKQEQNEVSYSLLQDIGILQDDTQQGSCQLIYVLFSHNTHFRQQNLMGTAILIAIRMYVIKFPLRFPVHQITGSSYKNIQDCGSFCLLRVILCRKVYPPLT